MSCARTELVFFDLIGFRAFNDQQGQQYGDEVLAWFAALVEQVPGTRAIRDGGDEFLLLGAPTRQGLATELLNLIAALAVLRRDVATVPLRRGRGV